MSGQFTDIERFRRILFYGITRQAIAVPETFNEFVHYPPRSYVISKTSLVLYRAVAKQALMMALCPSEHGWNYVCGLLNINPAKATEAASRPNKLREKMHSSESVCNLSRRFGLATADDAEKRVCISIGKACVWSAIDRYR